jgi:hypothetical protein
VLPKKQRKNSDASASTPERFHVSSARIHCNDFITTTGRSILFETTNSNENQPMNSVLKYSLVMMVTCVLSGCGGSDQNPLATDGATADDLAKYEAELAATNSDAGYDEPVPAE